MGSVAQQAKKPALMKLIEEKRRLEEKERILAEVQQHYSRFGEQVVTIILDYAFKEQGLAVLLKKLDVVSPVTREEQQDALSDYLSRNGPRRFLQLVKESREHAFLTGAGAAASVEKTQGEAVQDEVVPKTPPQSVERRSGKERRGGKDRRGNVELIFRNRRFGGERRSGVDRRKH
jgi:hypothetical protein